MRHFYVVTPPVQYVEVVTDEGQGPIVEECDVIEVEAPTKRDAILMGVREMLKPQNRRLYHYCRNQRADGCSPFTGVKALDPVCEDRE